MSGLSEEDKELWRRYTKDVQPLSDSPASPNERQSYVLCSRVVRKQSGASLDLHGLTIQDAYDKAIEYIEDIKDHYKSVVIITGLSGQINIEFPKWFEHHRLIRSIEPMNGGGAWKVCLKRSST